MNTFPKRRPQHTPVPTSGIRLPKVDSEPPDPLALAERATLAEPSARVSAVVPVSVAVVEKAHEVHLDDEVLTPRIVTFSVDDAVLAVVKVPLIECSPLSKLTPVERQVASLAARGLSNAAIGKQRGKSERTIANQMASILRKLEVGSRYELAALLAPCDLEREGQDGNDQP
jgi:DNA-binding NarL/FixJ family response regulator